MNSDHKDKSPDDATDQASEDAGQDKGWRPSRRTFLWLGAAGAAGALAAARLGFYPADDWDGEVLGEWEANVLAAAALALLPDDPGVLSRRGPEPLQIATNVDRFLVGMPKPMLLEIHAMFALIEHATLLDGSVLRFTRLGPPAQRDFLLRLRDMGSKFAQAFKGIRDLCLVGWYQDSRTWPTIGYDGPLLDRPAPPAVLAPNQAGRYEEFVAKPGQQPKGVL